LVELVVDTEDGDGSVAANAAALTDHEGRAQLCLVEAVDRPLRRGEDGARGAAHERGVGRDVVVAVEEREQPHLDVVERGDRAEVVEAALAQRPPPPFHLAARRRVVGLGVDERDAKLGAGGAERLAGVC
jgi:molybdopterin-guanine dinucleotide biosynthesis protein A